MRRLQYNVAMRSLPRVAKPIAVLLLLAVVGLVLACTICGMHAVEGHCDCAVCRVCMSLSGTATLIVFILSAGIALRRRYVKSGRVRRAVNPLFLVKLNC